MTRCRLSYTQTCSDSYGSVLLLVSWLLLITGVSGCITALGDLFAEPMKPEHGTWQGVLVAVPVVDTENNTHHALGLRVTSGRVDPGMSTYYLEKLHGDRQWIILVVNSHHIASSADQCGSIGKTVEIRGAVRAYDNPVFERNGLRVCLLSDVAFRKQYGGFVTDQIVVDSMTVVDVPDVGSVAPPTTTPAIRLADR